MNWYIQVMDLVVNGPCKAAIRRARTVSLFDYFQKWKIERLRAEKSGAVELPAFNPPKPKLADGIKTLLSICDTTFKKDDFVKALSKCFVDCCIAPHEEHEDEVIYKVYKDHKHGALNQHIFSKNKWPVV